MFNMEKRFRNKIIIIIIIIVNATERHKSPRCPAMLLQNVRTLKWQHIGLLAFDGAKTIFACVWEGIIL